MPALTWQCRHLKTSLWLLFISEFRNTRCGLSAYNTQRVQTGFICIVAGNQIDSILGICHEPYLALLHESLVHELPERDSSCKVPQNILIYCVQPSLGLVLSAYHQAVFPTDGFFDELDRCGRERGELLYVCG